MEARHTTSAAELKAQIEAEREGRPFLVFRDGEGEQAILPLEADAELWVGRSPSADVRLEWDEEVSALHAQIEVVRDECTLIDDGLSRNGSFVNEERVHGRRHLGGDEDDPEHDERHGQVVTTLDPADEQAGRDRQGRGDQRSHHQEQPPGDGEPRHRPGHREEEARGRTCAQAGEHPRGRDSHGATLGRGGDSGSECGLQPFAVSQRF